MAVEFTLRSGTHRETGAKGKLMKCFTSENKPRLSGYLVVVWSLPKQQFVGLYYSVKREEAEAYFDRHFVK